MILYPARATHNSLPLCLSMCRLLCLRYAFYKIVHTNFNIRIETVHTVIRIPRQPPGFPLVLQLAGGSE